MQRAVEAFVLLEEPTHEFCLYVRLTNPVVHAIFGIADRGASFSLM